MIIRVTVIVFTLSWIYFCGGVSPYLLAVELHPEQLKVFEEESKTMEMMRLKLKELLERQELQAALNAGNDVYKDFQELEQWLERLNREPSDAMMEKVMKILEEFEKQLSSILERQEYASTLTSGEPEPQKTTAKPLASLMQNIRQLLREGKIQEAQELLNQMLAAFDQQQQQLQNSLSSFYQSKYAELQKSLQDLSEKVQQAQVNENRVQSLLRPYLRSVKMTESTQRSASSFQEQVSQLAQKMRSQMESMPQSPFLAMEDLSAMIQRVQQDSQKTSSEISTGETALSYQATQSTQITLQQLQQTLTSMKQQVQQMASPRNSSESLGRRGQYWGEKGVRPLKFEYDFQANPQYRGEVQRLNQQKHPQMTPRQYQYLQEVIK
ncbi:hypothetical protein WDW89_20455 [Deltaproteobacteria bacterium TL4]